jgi:hypothetical protein
MKRILQAELLDSLSPDDPRAMRSRRDLRRVNAWMRNHAIMVRELKENLNGVPPRHITELGAGDGQLLRQVANTFSTRWPSPKLTLLDRQPVVAPETLDDFARIGWRAEVVVADIFDRPPEPCDVLLANLFLHHFETPRLKELLTIISQRTGLFIALEPRRAKWPLFCSRLLGAIGCNSVTRHDAVASVRAGFAGHELTSLWPEKDGWQLTERSAGPFSHLFVARKSS